MTVENKVVIEPEDIISLRFECAKCHAAVSIPIEAGISGHAANIATSSCNFCRTSWGFAPQSEEHMALMRFALGMEQIAKTMKGRNLHVKFEVRGPIKP